uniref:uncharacterized protein LOC122583311 n=1 Tax=Erigeron canadensis TaxID=72917 RepID=UPI001CB8E6F0|nr:uncharacterized protein LOC122583311 [Erigeron canadensis]
MIAWIMECVSTVSFSLCINGSLHGFFSGKRGLRQSDPLSPYLFTLVMEILTLMLQRAVRNSEVFRFYHQCEEEHIINLFFADDLFIFVHGDVASTQVIQTTFEEFKHAFGLAPSLPKSNAFFCNVLNHVKIGILNVMPFVGGNLPVKYLGVPLVSTRLIYQDCKELVDRIERRVSDWKNKFLSFAGRLQLTQSVLSSMHVYWSTVFILPARVIHDIEQIMRNFLWSQGEYKRGKSKVA